MSLLLSASTGKCSLLQDIKGFVMISKAWQILALKDLTGSKALEAQEVKCAAKKQHHAVSINVDRVSVWLPSVSLYILASLSANMGELLHVIDKRSSEDDAIKASQVILEIDSLRPQCFT